MKSRLKWYFAIRIIFILVCVSIAYMENDIVFGFIIYCIVDFVFDVSTIIDNSLDDLD